MSSRTFAAIVSGIVLAIGVILLVVPVNITTSGGTDTPCGVALTTKNPAKITQADIMGAKNRLTNALSGNRYEDPMNDATQLCDSAVSSRRTWSFVLIGVGVVALFGCGTIRRAPAPDTEG